MQCMRYMSVNRSMIESDDNRGGILSASLIRRMYFTGSRDYLNSFMGIPAIQQHATHSLCLRDKYEIYFEGIAFTHSLFQGRNRTRCLVTKRLHVNKVSDVSSKAVCRMNFMSTNSAGWKTCTIWL